MYVFMCLCACVPLWHGSIFSGSEMGYKAIHILLTEVSSIAGCDPPELIHQFAVEKEPYKAQWIIDHHGMGPNGVTRVFRDASELVQTGIRLGDRRVPANLGMRLVILWFRMSQPELYTASVYS